MVLQRRLYWKNISVNKRLYSQLIGNFLWTALEMPNIKFFRNKEKPFWFKIIFEIPFVLISTKS